MRGLRDVPVPEVRPGPLQGRGAAAAQRGSGHLLLRGLQPGRAAGGQKLGSEQEAHRVDTCGLFHDSGHHRVECCCSHMAGSDHCRVPAQRDGAEETQITELEPALPKTSNCSPQLFDWMKDECSLTPPLRDSRGNVWRIIGHKSPNIKAS